MNRAGTVLLWLSLLAAGGVQLAVGAVLRPLHPAIETMPPPPTPSALRATAFGDNQFLFRAQTQWLETVGDGGGRLRPLREFDYDRVTEWLRLVGDLDPRSDAVFQVGSTYYGALTDPATASTKLKPLVAYFETAAMADPAIHWSWLAWAAVKIQHVVKDPDLARRTAGDLLSLRQASPTPAWLPLLAIPLLRIAGEEAEADRLAHDPDMVARRKEAADSLIKATHVEQN